MKKFILPLFLLCILSTATFAQDVILKKGKYVDRETGKFYSGTFTEFDSLKRIVSVTCINNGLLNDSTVLYYPSGTVKEVRAYANGQKHGTWKSWNEKGVQTALASFTNGKKDGPWYIWDDNGIKRYEMFYRQGEKSGLWIIRDEQGNEISREEFK